MADVVMDVGGGVAARSYSAPAWTVNIDLFDQYKEGSHGIRLSALLSPNAPIFSLGVCTYASQERFGNHWVDFMNQD
ncbi:hypothetical protein [Comamonas sp. BIGb0124]|uniref:hypothetical protein n=1 Tax=Comamonas sp. BIGb0124 TaxID=2485130 RepID=UPI0011CEB8B9|nr:hypothetical protein [Comamonas sp. BIGb0124]